MQLNQHNTHKTTLVQSDVSQDKDQKRSSRQLHSTQSDKCRGMTQSWFLGWRTLECQPHMSPHIRHIYQDKYTVLNKYSPPLSISSLCSLTTWNWNGLDWDFMSWIHTKRPKHLMVFSHLHFTCVFSDIKCSNITVLLYYKSGIKNVRWSEKILFGVVCPKFVNRCFIPWRRKKTWH